jgi:predicted Ser/Thr protein kinase
MRVVRWDVAGEIEALFHEVADLEREEASRVLEERCSDAPQRRRAVEELLTRERALPASFLEPDAQLVARVVDTADRALSDMRATPTPLARDERVGHFTLIERIGQGAAGGVYLAQDEALDRRVVLKVMHQPTELSSGATREARALARLSHFNVVRLYEIGEYHGRPFMAMEWIPGCNLQAWLRNQPRTLAEILGMFMQAGRGLLAAHQAGLVHCDFKPENVLVGADGRVCVADFGVAAIVMSDVPPDNMGTPAFMAPEQFTGDDVTPATDQFAYCVALYSALFAAAPFDGADAVTLRAAVLSGALRKRERGHAVPARLVSILERGLKSDPAARFPSMSALLAELEEILPNRVAQEPAPARRARTLVCGSMVLLGGIALLGFHGSSSRWLVPDKTSLLVMPSLALLLHAGAAATLRQTLFGNPFSRKVVAMIWLGGITVILHRVMAFRFGQSVPEVIAVDLLMLTLEQIAAALLLARSFGFAALFFLTGAVVALLVPSHAVSAMLGSVMAAYMLPIVFPGRERTPAHSASPQASVGRPTSRHAFKLSDRVSAS